MARARKKAIIVALDPGMNALLKRAAEARRVSKSEFIRQVLSLVLDQHKKHPKPRAAGIVKPRLLERGDEAEIYAASGAESPPHPVR